MKETKDPFAEVDELLPEPPSTTETDKYYLRNDGSNKSETKQHSHSHESYFMDFDDMSVEYFPFASQKLSSFPKIHKIGKRQQHGPLSMIKGLLMNKNDELDIKFDRILALFTKSKLLIPPFFKEVQVKVRTFAKRSSSIALESPCINLPSWADPLKNINFTQLGIGAIVTMVFGVVDGFLEECIAHISNEKIKSWATSCKNVLSVLMTLSVFILIIASAASITSFTWVGVIGLLISLLGGLLVSYVMWKVGELIGSFFATSLISFLSWIVPEKWKTNVESVVLDTINAIESVPSKLMSHFSNQPLPSSNSTQISELTIQPSPVVEVQPLTLDETMNSIRERCKGIRYRCVNDHSSPTDCDNNTTQLFWRGDVCQMCYEKKALAIGLHVDRNIELTFCKDCFESNENSLIKGIIENTLNIDIENVDFFLLTLNRLCKQKTCFKFTKCDSCYKPANVFLKNEIEKSVYIGLYCEDHEETDIQGIDKIEFVP